MPPLDGLDDEGVEPGPVAGMVVDDPCERDGKVTGGAIAGGRPYPVLLVVICGWPNWVPGEYGIPYAGASGSPLFPKNAFT